VRHVEIDRGSVQWWVSVMSLISLVTNYKNNTFYEWLVTNKFCRKTVSRKISHFGVQFETNKICSFQILVISALRTFSYYLVHVHY
jgi:hypothetical protein